VRHSRWTTVLVTAALAFGLAACASIHRAEWNVLSADPAPESGFIDRPEQLDFETLAPFQGMWTSPEVDWRKFPKLYVAPVDTGHLLPMSLWDKTNIRESKVASYDVFQQAIELRERVEDAFRNDPQQHFIVLDDASQIDEQTVVLELSLVELVPNKAILGVVGIGAWAMPLVIGIPLATLTAFIAHGQIAIEGDVREAGSDQVLLTFTDREIGKMRVIDLRSVTWYANAHESMDEWADALVELANAPPGHKVKHAGFFTFMPW
jgi:uncharacterized protein DUF3313